MTICALTAKNLFTSVLAMGMMAVATPHALASDKPVLTIYTYDSFVSEWGPGPAVKTTFERTCDCTVDFVAAGDSAALLARLRLEGARSTADVVLGLDTNLMATAIATELFAPHGISTRVSVPTPFNETDQWQDRYFLPYDWGYFAFVYDNTRLSTPPKSFEELAASDLEIVIQDPRSSTPGLGLLMWIKDIYGPDAEAIWADLSDNILTATKGWSEAYGIFLQNEADMVLSYTTSPAYHIVAENDPSKSAAIFDSHYMQVEVAGKLLASDQADLADRFLRFMLTEKFQSIIPTTNWMYPVIPLTSGLPEGFAPPIRPDQARLVHPDDVPSLREEALQEWLTALSR